MSRRTHVSINPEELEKLDDVEQKRPDMKGYNISKKVHVALQEWFKENLKSPAGSIHETKPLEFSSYNLAVT